MKRVYELTDEQARMVKGLCIAEAAEYVYYGLPNHADRWKAIIAELNRYPEEDNSEQ